MSEDTDRQVALFATLSTNTFVMDLGFGELQGGGGCPGAEGSTDIVDLLIKGGAELNIQFQLGLSGAPSLSRCFGLLDV